MRRCIGECHRIRFERNFHPLSGVCYRCIEQRTGYTKPEIRAKIEATSSRLTALRLELVDKPWP